MRTLVVDPPLRVAVLATPETSWRLPAVWPGLDVRVIRIDGGGWPEGAAEAVAHRAEVTLVLDPASGAAVADRLPGIRVAVALRLGDAERCVGTSGYHWFTLPARSSRLEARLPVLGLLVPPLDLGRRPAPRLECGRGAVLPWAAPPPALLEQLRTCLPVDLLPAGDSPSALATRLEGYGALFHYGSTTIPMCEDLAPLLAMSRGLLLVVREPFPVEWEIEAGDDYLVLPDPGEWPSAASRISLAPRHIAPVRVRAWQKAGEAFDAGPFLGKVAVDALLRSEPDRFAARAVGGPGRPAGP